MITNNDIKKAKFKCYSIYMQFQAVMAGQSVDCEERLENEFNDICSEFGFEPIDMWAECEDNHSLSMGV